MEVMIAVQSGTLLRALRVQLKRRVSVRRGGDYNEVPQAIQKKRRSSPSNCVTPFACKLLFINSAPSEPVCQNVSRTYVGVHVYTEKIQYDTVLYCN